MNPEYNEMDTADYVKHGHRWLMTYSVEQHVHDQGSWVRNLMEELDHDTRIHVLKEISLFALKLVNGILQVQAERNSDNNTTLELAPPVMPSELVLMRSKRFNKLVLDPYCLHIAKFWTVEQIDQIERDHKDLLKSFIEESATKALIKKHDVKTMFNNAWNDLPRRFLHLRDSCGGFGSAFANTTSVESDFSVLKWEKDDFCQSMTNLTLEGIFQTKQSDMLGCIFTE